MATIIATSMGGVHTVTQAVNRVATQGSKRLSPFTMLSFLANLAAAHISIKYGFKGIIGAPGAAFAASLQAIGDGYNSILNQDAVIAVVGGSDACINPVTLGGFNAARALTTPFNNSPAKASCPFDSSRSGFVISEGAGLLVLEELAHAKKRGVPILAEIKGYGTTSDAWHITSVPKDGEGIARAMTIALRKAALNAKDIDYIHAHATSTIIGDNAELAALRTVFSTYKIYISSTKSSTGHLLGASGVTGASFSIKALNENILPPSLNIDNLDEKAEGLNIIANKAILKNINYVMVNGSGFGGVNASVIFKSYEN